MLDNLKDYVSRFPDAQRLNHLREYLQWLILKIIDERGFRRSVAFTGGTAIRVVYGAGRFSEDLDFSRIGAALLDGAAMARDLRARLERYGLKCVLSRLRERRTVVSFFLRFPGLLHPLEISPHRDQILSIKIEIDTRPPKGGSAQEYLFREPLMFWITHFDLPSLFATKLHAVLFRKFDKGRDLYDLVFYLRKEVHPVLKLFQNAVAQTHPREKFPSEKSVFEAVAEKVRKLDWGDIRRDVRPFLLDPREERFLTVETVTQLLRQGSYLSGK